MNTSTMWKTTSSAGNLGINQLQGWAPMLREGLHEKGSWGYGIKRLTVKESTGSWPMTFSAMAYKNEQGKWFLGLRMNIDQVSPIKFRDWNDGDNIVLLLADLMSEHMREHGCVGDFGQVV